MISSQISSSRLAITKNTRVKVFGTAQSLPGSQQDNYQSFTIQFFGKTITEEKNPWELILAIQHFQRLVITYHKDNLEKLAATSAPINMASLMAMPTALLMARLQRLQQKNMANLLRLPLLNKQKSPRLFSCLIPSGFLFYNILLVGQEVFYQSHFINLFVFLLNIFLSQEVCHQLIIYILILIVPLGIRSMILRNLVFFLYFLIQQAGGFFHPFHKLNTK